MVNLYSIGNVCGAEPGLKSVLFTDMENLSGHTPGSLPLAPGAAPSFVDTDLVFSVAFNRFSAVIDSESRRSQGGDYVLQNLRLFVPRSRLVVSELLRRLRSRKVMAIGIDHYNNQHIMFDALASYTHTTGAKWGDRHGYFITLSAYSYFVNPSIAGQGDIPTAPPDPTDPPDPPSGDCCITINPIPIAYTPTPTGNAYNLNQLVTTPNGSLYFISSTGAAVIVNRPAPRYYIGNFDGVNVTEFTLPAGFPLPDPDDYPFPVYDEQAEISVRLFIKYGTRYLDYDRPGGFTINHAANKILVPSGIRGGNIQVWSFEGIPPRPI